jgi:glycerophosphoryl diester phosphodiesterase
MKIIGHRGAAGSELENTLASLQAAINLGVYAVEFDIRKTKDDNLVVCHDADLARIANDKRKISDLTLKQLQKIPLLTGSSIPTLIEALEVIDGHRCFIELKDRGCSALLIDVLKQFPKAKVSIASFKLDELAALRALAPFKLSLYGLERTKPFDIIHFAKQFKLDGVGLNYWLLNPLTYWRCRRAGLDMYVYTVNRPFQAKFLNLLYPDVAICTDYPDRFRKKRRTSR